MSSTDAARRLVLVRHGQSRWNAEGRIQGQACSGLSDRGVQQARAVARHLADEFPDAEVITSDLPRAEQTAQAICDLLGRPPQFDEAVRERHFGQWQAHTGTEVAAKDHQRWQRWLSGEDLLGDIGGESDDTFGQRVDAALQDCWRRTEPGRTTIVVTHGGVIWHGTHRWLKLAQPTLGSVHNTSATHLVGLDAEVRWCDRWNEIAHLPVELRDPDVRHRAHRAVGR